MRTKALFITLFLLTLITCRMSFGVKRKCRKEKNYCKGSEQLLSETDICGDNESETPDYYYNNCDPEEFGIVQKIPYFNCRSSCNTIQIDFSSACIRCGMCLAIAEKINQTLLDVHEMMSSSACLNDTEVELLLRTICDHAFQYYRLRELDGTKFICDDSPGSILVSTSADELWGKKLRDLCHYYLDEIGEVQLYEQWQGWCNDDEDSPDISDVMCRSEVGLLRDCRNMENPEKYEPAYKTYNTKVKITATYGKYDNLE